MVERAFSLDGGEHDTTGAIGIGDGATPGDAFGAVNFGGGGGTDGSGTRDSAGTEFDPAIHSGIDKLNGDGTFRKRRGRKPGGVGSSSNQRQTRKADLSASLDALSSTLMVVHAGIASVTKIKELALDKDDSDALAKATANVLNEFDVTPDPKVQAIVGLIMTAGMIYGPKLYMYNERMKSEKKESKSADVLPFEMVQ